MPPELSRLLGGPEPVQAGYGGGQALENALA